MKVKCKNCGGSWNDPLFTECPICGTILEKDDSIDGNAQNQEQRSEWRSMFNFNNYQENLLINANINELYTDLSDNEVVYVDDVICGVRCFITSKLWIFDNRIFPINAVSSCTLSHLQPKNKLKKWYIIIAAIAAITTIISLVDYWFDEGGFAFLILAVILGLLAFLSNKKKTKIFRIGMNNGEVCDIVDFEDNELMFLEASILKCIRGMEPFASPKVKDYKN